MKICPACNANPTTEPCDECDGAGFVRERHERLKAALDACDYQQFVMVSDALRAVCDDLRAADALSPSAWLILGLLDGQPPVKAETRAKLGKRITGRKAA